jgi:hypothetical protein
MLDIVIVNWNAGLQLRTCIESIVQHGSGLVNKTIVVDNGSVDGSEIGIDAFPNVVLLRNSTNHGFAKACNLGAQQASGEFLLFLNPDAALFPETLSGVVAYLQNPVNVKVGICGVQLLDEAGHISRSCARFPSLTGFVVRAVGLDRFFPRLGHFMAEWDHAQTREVDHVIGAFFLVRRKLFKSLSGFDERFFVYLEDVDFSYRARQAGWQSMYLASGQAFHAGGGTSHQVKAHRLFYSLRSRMLYACKHFSWVGAFLAIMVTLFVEPISRSVLAIGRRSWTDMKEIWSAYSLLWSWLPQWLFKDVTR